MAPGHGLFAAAGEEGLLECFDLRQRRSVGALDAAAAAGAVRLLSLSCRSARLCSANPQFWEGSCYSASLAPELLASFSVPASRSLQSLVLWTASEVFYRATMYKFSLKGTSLNVGQGTLVWTWLRSATLGQRTLAWHGQTHAGLAVLHSFTTGFQPKDGMPVQPGEGLTALRFSDSGLQCAVGTANGLVALYDLRSLRPLIVKDHNYGAAIKDIKFHVPDSMAGARASNCLTS